MEAKHPLAVWRETQEPRLTQKAFGKLVGTSTWTINSIETGRRKPGRELILNISKATNNAVGFAELAEAA